MNNINDDYQKKIEEFQKLILEETRKVYLEKTIKYFMKPENLGRIADPDGFAQVKGRCGDTMEMYLKIKEEKVDQILFFTDGCGVTIACGSLTKVFAKGKNVKDVLRIAPADIINELGLSDYDTHCAILAVTTLHFSVADYLIKNMMKRGETVIK